MANQSRRRQDDPTDTGEGDADVARMNTEGAAATAVDAAPALAEAWCVARLGLNNGSLSRHSAMAVIVAIEGFAPKRPAYLSIGQRDGQRSSSH